MENTCRKSCNLKLPPAHSQVKLTSDILKKEMEGLFVPRAQLCPKCHIPMEAMEPSALEIFKKTDQTELSGVTPAGKLAVRQRNPKVLVSLLSLDF